MPETLTEVAALSWLRQAAQSVSSTQACVEIGVYRGGSLACLAEGAAAGRGAQVYGVDAWGLAAAYPSRPHMHQRYVSEDMAVAAQTAPGATLIRSLSVDAARAWDGPPIGLLYIDGEHTRKAVLADFAAWRVHLAVGAEVAFDDHYDRFPGVKQAVAELVAEGSLEWVELVGSRLAVTRAAPLGAIVCEQERS